jgi:RNase adapter protein RapZ
MTQAQDKRRSASETGGADRFRALLVTGMSGAGKTTVLKALEDVGFEAVDNLPLSLLKNLMFLPDRRYRPIAVGIDVRTRDFGVQPVLAELDALDGENDLSADLIFLDCEDEVIARRFTETRRRHPLGEDRPPLDGIRHERRLLRALRDRADLVIDTSLMTPHGLRRFVEEQFRSGTSAEMTVFVMSFSYRQGLPREADLVFDVRFLQNPHYEPGLRQLTGKIPEVGDYIRRDPAYPPFVEALQGLLDVLVPRYRAEGKSYLTIAFGCTGGQHRSVYLAHRFGEWLSSRVGRVSVLHRELDR